MDDNTIKLGKKYLYAHCITEGALDDMSEEQRTAFILDINEIKEAMLKEYHPPIATEKYTSKVSK